MTFSGVYRHAGNLYGAVATHPPNCGEIVLHGMPNVGIVCAQAMNDQGMGPEILRRMKDGESAEVAFGNAVAEFGNREHRQIVILPFNGAPYAFTGELCSGHKGDLSGENWAVAGNTLANPGVFPALAREWQVPWTSESNSITALEIANNEGGDARGVLSAAVMRVSGNSVVVKYVDFEPRDAIGALRNAPWCAPSRPGGRPPNAADPHMRALGKLTAVRTNERYNRAAFQGARALAPPEYQPTITCTEARLLYETGSPDMADALTRELLTEYPEWRTVLRYELTFGAKYRSNVVELLDGLEKGNGATGREDSPVRGVRGPDGIAL